MNLTTPYADLIPPLRPDELSLLEASIIAEGCRDPLIVWRGILVDGHNRHEICKRNGIAFETREMKFKNEKDVRIWIFNNQLGRRNLEPLQRVAMAKMKTDILRPIAKEQKGTRTDLSAKRNSGYKPIDVTQEIADLAGVSRHTASRGIQVLEKATPEEIKEIVSGENRFMIFLCR